MGTMVKLNTKIINGATSTVFNPCFLSHWDVPLFPTVFSMVSSS